VSDAVVEYLISAVRLVARSGWRLLPDYRFDNATGRWRHRRGPVEPPLRLAQTGYAVDGTFSYPRHELRASESALSEYLVAGEAILERGVASAGQEGRISPDFDDLRWFELPAECLSPSD